MSIMIHFVHAVPFTHTNSWTWSNLTAPHSVGSLTIHQLPDACFPLGGVTRLFGYAWLLTQGGGYILIERFGHAESFAGLGMTCVGIDALGHIRNSLLGDILTLPIAYARLRGAAWASWWGERVNQSGY